MKDIEGFEGEYAITEDGQVFSYKSNRFLKITKGSSGYMQVQLSKKGKVKSFLIQRLVANAFIPNPQNLPEVNHKDENRENNQVENLEWCDRKYNVNYGTRAKKFAKARGKAVHCIELDKDFESAADAARQLNLNPSCISACCKGRLKTTGKLHFNYLNEVNLNETYTSSNNS